MEKSTAFIFVLVNIILALFLIMSCGLAHAHSWYPTHCCNEGDCKPVPCDELVIKDTRVYWHGLSTAAYIIKPSPDGLCHVCNDTQRLRCVFKPDENV